METGIGVFIILILVGVGVAVAMHNVDKSYGSASTPPPSALSTGKPGAATSPKIADPGPSSTTQSTPLKKDTTLEPKSDQNQRSNDFSAANNPTEIEDHDQEDDGGPCLDKELIDDGSFN